MGERGSGQRRSLRYIRLAAFLAAQPPEVDGLEMSVTEIEDIVGATLPAHARFPSWWRNDNRRAHSRAWMTAGWSVVHVSATRAHVVFARRSPERDTLDATAGGGGAP